MRDNELLSGSSNMNANSQQIRFEQFEKAVYDVLASGLPEDRGHAANTLCWLLYLSPDADEVLQCVAIAHDIERSIPPRVTRRPEETFLEYKTRHAVRRAELVEQLLRGCRYSDSEIRQVRELISNHEGANALPVIRDADLISFFDHNLTMFFDRSGSKITMQRIIDNLRSASRRAFQIINSLPFEEPVASLYKSALSEIKLPDNKTN